MILVVGEPVKHSSHTDFGLLSFIPAVLKKHAFSLENGLRPTIYNVISHNHSN